MSLTRGRAVVVVVVLGLVLASSADARKRRIRKRMKTAVTDVLQPSIQGFFGGAHGLAADLDGRLGRQLSHVDTITGKLVDQTNMAVGDRIAQVDQSLEARIVQVDASANNLVRNAMGRLDVISRRRIAQLGGETRQAVRALDDVAEERLQQADKILAERLGDVDNLVQDAIRSTDKAMEARIEQIDEALGRRLGNVDAVLAKERLGLERTLIRVSVAAAACVFVLLCLWWLWKSFRRTIDAVAHGAAQRRRTVWWRTFAAPGLGVVFGASLAVAGAIWSVDRIPIGAQKDLAALVEDHQVGYERSLRGFDLLRARFHAAQLELLDPGPASMARAKTEKVNLVRMLFGRPTSLATPEGQAAIEAQILKVERALGDTPDPDVLVVKAFVLWRGGESRLDEHRAASLCARALRMRPGGFALSPLARNYIHNFLHAPFITRDVGVGRDRESLRAMRALVGDSQRAPPRFALRHMLVFNGAVRALERRSTAAYLEMLAAHARLVAPGAGESMPADGIMPLVSIAAARDARTARTEAARQVLQAWRAFEARIDDATQLQTSPSILGLFRLNDAMLVRAMWFVHNMEADTLPPLLRDIPDAVARARLAPPRVAWSREYANVLGTLGHQVLDLQEYERYLAFEEATEAFDRAYVAARREPPQIAEARKIRQGDAAYDPRRCSPGEAGLEAAQLAAQLGLYVEDGAGGRVPFGWSGAAAVRDWLAPIGMHDRRGDSNGSLERCGDLGEDTRGALSARVMTLL
ncbi:MAG: hypothetical protein V3V08_14965 [Nannocystaceae bacterium]